MAPVGRRKSSIPSPGGPAGNGGGSIGGGGGVADDIAHLSLAEVQARLERNARVLGLALFSPSTSPLSPSPLAGPFPPSTPAAQAGAAAAAAAGGSGAVDPVRAKLLLARQALLDRQSELLLQSAQNGLSAIHVDPSLDPPSNVGGSPVAGPSKSGSQRALEEIRMRDRDLAPRSRMMCVLPFLTLLHCSRELPKLTRADRLTKRRVWQRGIMMTPLLVGYLLLLSIRILLKLRPSVLDVYRVGP